MPTGLVFDLDPGEGADIFQACEVAFLVKDLLERLKLASFAKVSGSKGIHLHVPLNSAVTYGSTRPFARSIAQAREQKHPDIVVSDMAKANRRGKIFIDWSQNASYKSTVAPYSLRAKQDQPYVAMPISWSKVKGALKKRQMADR